MKAGAAVPAFFLEGDFTMKIRCGNCGHFKKVNARLVVRVFACLRLALVLGVCWLFQPVMARPRAAILRRPVLNARNRRKAVCGRGSHAASIANAAPAM